jgi:hypothetical protein
MTREIAVSTDRQTPSALDLFCDGIARWTELSYQFSSRQIDKAVLPDGRSYPDLKRQTNDALEILACSSPQDRSGLEFLRDALDHCITSAGFAQSNFLASSRGGWVGTLHEKTRSTLPGIPHPNRHLLQGTLFERARRITSPGERLIPEDRQEALLTAIGEEEEKLTDELLATGIDPASCTIDRLVRGIVSSVLADTRPHQRRQLTE